MLKPTAQVHNEAGILVGEFWDCLRLDSGAVQELRTKYEAHLRAGAAPVDGAAAATVPAVAAPAGSDASMTKLAWLIGAVIVLAIVYFVIR